MISEKLQKEYTGLRFEIIDLNQTSYFFIRKINRMMYIMQSTTREFLLEEFFSLRYLENGIILHLTNLDDDSSKYSFRKARRFIEKNNIITDQEYLRTLKNKIDSYRQSVNHLKTAHRNLRIAHINSLDFPKIDEFINFEKKIKPLIIEANLIADYIWGEEIQVKFKLGSLEGTLNFRDAINNLKVDYSKNKEFA